FRRPGSVTNPAHAIGFLSYYLGHLPQGPDLPATRTFFICILHTIWIQQSPQHLGQLYEFMRTTKGAWK
ncbi:hypothetical protein FB451DRAFT_954543, partial [Mycena latifolia]